MRSKFHFSSHKKPLTIRNDPGALAIHTPNRLDLTQEEAFRLADLLVDHAEKL